MKKIFALIAFILFVFFGADAQNTNNKKFSNDTAKIHKWYSEAENNLYTKKKHFRKSFTKLNAGLDLSNQIRYWRGMGLGNRKIAYYYWKHENDTMKALQFYMKAQTIFEQSPIKDSLEWAYTYEKIAYFFDNAKKDQNKALDYYKKALALYQKCKDIQAIKEVAFEIWGLHSTINLKKTTPDFDSCIVYYNIIVKNCYQTKDTFLLARIYALQDIGRNMENKKEVEQCKILVDSAFLLLQLQNDKSIYTLRTYTTAYMSKGIIYHWLQQLDSAEYYYKKVFENEDKLLKLRQAKDIGKIAASWYNLSLIKNEENRSIADLVESIKYAKSSIDSIYLRNIGIKNSTLRVAIESIYSNIGRAYFYLHIKDSMTYKIDSAMHYYELALLKAERQENHSWILDELINLSFKYKHPNLLCYQDKLINTFANDTLRVRDSIYAFFDRCLVNGQDEIGIEYLKYNINSKYIYIGNIFYQYLIPRVAPNYARAIELIKLLQPALHTEYNKNYCNITLADLYTRIYHETKNNSYQDSATIYLTMYQRQISIKDNNAPFYTNSIDELKRYINTFHFLQTQPSCTEYFTKLDSLISIKDTFSCSVVYNYLFNTQPNILRYAGCGNIVIDGYGLLPFYVASSDSLLSGLPNENIIGKRFNDKRLVYDKYMISLGYIYDNQVSYIKALLNQFRNNQINKETATQLLKIRSLDSMRNYSGDDLLLKAIGYTILEKYDSAALKWEQFSGYEYMYGTILRNNFANAYSEHSNIAALMAAICYYKASTTSESYIPYQDYIKKIINKDYKVSYHTYEYDILLAAIYNECCKIDSSYNYLKKFVYNYGYLDNYSVEHLRPYLRKQEQYFIDSLFVSNTLHIARNKLDKNNYEDTLAYRDKYGDKYYIHGSKNISYYLASLALDYCKENNISYSDEVVSPYYILAKVMAYRAEYDTSSWNKVKEFSIKDLKAHKGNTSDSWRLLFDARFYLKEYEDNEGFKEAEKDLDSLIANRNSLYDNDGSREPIYLILDIIKEKNRISKDKDNLEKANIEIENLNVQLKEKNQTLSYEKSKILALNDSLNTLNSLLKIKNDSLQLASQKLKDALSQEQETSLANSRISRLLMFSFVILVYFIFVLRKQKKEIALLKDELTHRISNNLKNMVAEIELYKRTKEESIRKELEKVQGMISNSVKVHDLISSKNNAYLKVGDYLQQLLENVLAGTNIKSDVSQLYNKEHFEWRQMTFLGIVCQELLTNSIKHAFEGIENPHIRVSLEKVKHSKFNYKLIYSDNGIGLPNDYKNRLSLGHSILVNSIEKLKGTITSISNSEFGGTTFEIFLKIEK